MRADKPSRTALKVAMAIVTLDKKPGMAGHLPPGIVPATEKLLLASGVAGAKTLRWARSSKALAVYKAFDWLMPGQLDAFAHRKAFCEHQVRAAISDGATQILVLGAGYDTTGWRLAPEFPDVTFFEIDHPATARLKARGITAMGQPENLVLLAEDLAAQRLVDVLDIPTWDRQAQTVFVAEGLLMYLSAEVVRDLFLQCDQLSGEKSRVAFSYIPRGLDGRPDAGRWTGLLLWLRKAAGEPWLWSAEAENPGSALQDTSWSVEKLPAEEAVRRGVEYFAVAVKETPESS